MCLTQRHLPSVPRICSAATGWDHRTVMLPKSDVYERARALRGARASRTCMALQPDVVRFCFLFLRARIAADFVSMRASVSRAYVLFHETH